MDQKAGMYFDGVTRQTDTQETVQAHAGNATWVNEFIPTAQDHSKPVSDALLWLLHKLGSCCAIVGEYDKYIVANTLRHHIWSLYTWPTRCGQMFRLAWILYFKFNLKIFFY
jgi:hypothetical protein